MEVKAWKAKVTIPTYETGEPEKFPFFLEKRVYQGSSGAVYPYPVTEKINDVKVDKVWDVIFLENHYLKLMIIPALGGRIQMAYDKVKERHFVYYNQVIKPALVGLTGPWISGGIEFNWPQHHRPSTYEPIDSLIMANDDHSKTVWVSEIERMTRTKGMAGFTLYKDKAYLEVKVQLYNRTPHPQSFLWWANPAVSVNEHYQSVFPPDVNAVFDHGKRDVSSFPIAKGTYYKVDYSPGTDISRYQNIPVPTSFMAVDSEYDFVGGYDHECGGGLLHIANHHISPGKKQWTWGNGDFGHTWDRNLTDNDGPYIELMCGVYTDNQPDFSWLHPYEEKSFKQYFIPYHNVGVVKNATKEALVNVLHENGKTTIKIHVTAIYSGCSLSLVQGDHIIMDEIIDLNPESAFERTVSTGAAPFEDLALVLKAASGHLLVEWSGTNSPSKDIPEPARSPKAPQDISSTEQLFLTGLHLEQYRHATYDPRHYYVEALSREPGDVRCNNALGLWYLRRAQFEKALFHFNVAINTLTAHNPNPYDGEPFFNRGLVLNLLGRRLESYNSFFKSCWSNAWQDAGYFNLALIDCSQKNYNSALELVDKSLVKNWHNHKARHLRAMLLRYLGKSKEALQWVSDSLAIDPFNFGVLFEKYLLTQAQRDLICFAEILRGSAHNYIECSLDFAQAGFYNEAIQILELFVKDKKEVYPMIYYFLGWYHRKKGDRVNAKEHWEKAKRMPMDFCFPNRLEEVLVIKEVMEWDQEDARAPYYLGNFWYAARQYGEAQECWEIAIARDSDNAICHRNLALLYYNKLQLKDKALKHLENALALDDQNARLLMELDQLHKKQNISLEERMQLLTSNMVLTERRDDLYLEYVTLHNLNGQHLKVLLYLEKRHFHPWEGGEGKVAFQFVTAHVELAKKQIFIGSYEDALAHLEKARTYPSNLGEGKLYGAQENDVDYWSGVACLGMGNEKRAIGFWTKSAKGKRQPNLALFYNDQQPDKIFYQGLSLIRLGQQKEAEQIFHALIQYGQNHLNDKIAIDYFAVSLPDLHIWEEDLDLRNQTHCWYLIGLGNLGLGRNKLALQAFKKAILMDSYHLPSVIHEKMALKQLELKGK